MTESNPQQQQKSDSDIFDARKHVRLRPGMYVGGTDKKALHLMLEDVIYDAVEEIISGRGSHIWIILRHNNEIIIKDNGAGIPVDREANSGRSFLEHYLTCTLRNSRRKNGEYGLAHGMFELGISYVSALCSMFNVEVKRDGSVWQQTYEQGLPTRDVIQVRNLNMNEETGTTITFTPDLSIFERNEFDYNIIFQRVKDIAYSVSGVKMTISDERKSPALIGEFQFPNGMADLVRTLNEGQQVLHEIIHYRGTCLTGVENRQKNMMSNSHSNITIQAIRLSNRM